MQLTTEQAAYLAGAIDGEGWIGFERKSAGGLRVSAGFSPRLTIANTGREWLELLQSWAGGGKLNKTEADGSRNRRACYRLTWCGYGVKTTLSVVMPYLILKKRQAELVLASLELTAARRATSRNAVRADPAIVAQQQAVYDEVRALNKRGHVDAKSPGGTRTNRACGVTGCGCKHYGRGYCWIHYRKYIVRGGPARYDKECANCGAAFVAARSSTLCCSKRCTDERYYAANSEQIKAQVARYKERRKQAADTSASETPSTDS